MWALGTLQALDAVNGNKAGGRGSLGAGVDARRGECLAVSGRRDAAKGACRPAPAPAEKSGAPRRQQLEGGWAPGWPPAREPSAPATGRETCRGRAR